MKLITIKRQIGLLNSVFHITVLILVIIAEILLGGCGQKGRLSHPVNPNKPIERVLMEPIVIKAQEQEGGEIKFEYYDAESLFDEGLKAIDEGNSEKAVKYFEKIISEFPGTSFIEAAIFNAGYCREMLSLKENKEANLIAAIALYERLIKDFPNSPYIIDSLFRKGYCLEALGKNEEALKLYQTMLEERKDLKTQDKIELKARVGEILFWSKEFSKAEKELRDTVFFFKQSSQDERIENTYYAAQAQFDIAEIMRMKFESINFSIDEKEIRQQLEEKLGYMIKAKDAYIATIKIGNYIWAVASGYRIGMLYKTLYDQIMNAPIPPKINTPELKKVYMELLEERVRPLLKSSISVWEKTLLMAERVGYQGEWTQKVENAIEETMQIINK